VTFADKRCATGSYNIIIRNYFNCNVNTFTTILNFVLESFYIKLDNVFHWRRNKAKYVINLKKHKNNLNSE
jgi:hypothetical protein